MEPLSAASSPSSWPVGGGEMGEHVRGFDWGASPLGQMTTWPQSLRSIVDLMLGCAFPMIVLWGPELTQIYNDGYRDLMGNQHPTGLGQATRDCWPEVWHINEPLYARVWQGETLTFADALSPIMRHGSLEDAWFTLCYSPLRDETQVIGGMLVTAFETTQHHCSEEARQRIEAALHQQEARQAYILHLNDALQPIGDPLAIETLVTQTAMAYFAADRCYYTTIADDQAIIRRDAMRGDAPSVAGTYPLKSFPLLKTVVEEGRPFVVHDVQTADIIDEALRDLCLTLEVISFLNVPVVKQGKTVGVLCLVQATARTWTADEVALATETAERTWAAVERANVEEAVRRSEARYRALAQMGAYAVYQMSPDWSEMRALSGNGFIADTTQPSTSWLARYIHPDDQPEITKAIQQAIHAKTLFELEHRVRRADGSLGWTLSRAVPLVDAQGLITEWIGAASDITARKQWEETLRESEERFRLLAETLPQIVWTSDDQDVGYFNDHWYTYTGLTPAQSLKQAWFQVIHPDDFAEVSKRVSEASRFHQPYQIEYRLRAADGTYRWHLARAVRHPHRALWIGAAMDIDDLKQTQESLRLSESRFQQFTDQSQDVLWIWNVATGNVEFVSPAVHAVWGLSPDVVRRDLTQLTDCVHPDDRPEALMMIPRALEGETVHRDYRIYAVDTGTERWLHDVAFPMRDAHEQIERVGGIAQDITARKQWEEALRASEHRFRTLTNLVPDLLWQVDTTKAIRIVNQQWRAYTGQPGEEIPATIWWAAIHPDDRVAAQGAFAAAFATGEALERELRIQRADGDYRWFLVRQVPIADDQGHLSQWLGAATDIHDQRREREELTEQVAVATEQLRALSRRLLQVQEEERRHMARELHDEIGQALTGVQLHLAVIKQASKQERFVPLDEAEALVRDLTTRVSALSVELRPSVLDHLGLLPALIWYLERYQQRTGLAVEFRHAGLDQRLATEVEVAAYRLVQEALTNIARHAKAQGVTILALADAETVTLTIHDDGQGFDLALTKVGGGLSGMRERVELLDGTLEIESAAGAGTTTVATLPTHPPTVHTQESDR